MVKIDSEPASAVTENAPLSKRKSSKSSSFEEASSGSSIELGKQFETP